MRPWQLGNTSVRSALRTRDALVALDAAGIEGTIRGRDGDIRFRNVLGEAGVVSLGDDATKSVGRKFRAALTKLGFLFPKVTGDFKQSDIGEIDAITPAGRRLIDASSLSAQQECLLRAVSGISFTLLGSEYKESGAFSPLLHSLRIMKQLETRTGDSYLSMTEFGLYVQTSSNDLPVGDVVEEILQFRTSRKSANNKKKFDEAGWKWRCEADGCLIKANSYQDYADMNLRYLRATGLFSRQGRGICIAPEKSNLVDGIIQTLSPKVDKLEYWLNLTAGPPLPTDSVGPARLALDAIIEVAKDRQIDISFDPTSVVTAADLHLKRHELEAQIAIVEEVSYAKAQADQWPEIVAFLTLFESGKFKASGDDGAAIVVPKGEGPAYLEWSVWRAFLAINHLVNPPYESRRFQVDRDLLPIDHAPGGGPDLVFEFETFVLVVEVTLLGSGRQEAAEGYPVRQHVFNTAQKYSQVKPVYGLFIAPTLDINTVATFRLGQWHDSSGEFRVNIVPLTVAQFNSIFREMFVLGAVNFQYIRKLLDACLALRDAPQPVVEWQLAIEKELTNIVSSLTPSQ